MMEREVLRYSPRITIIILMNFIPAIRPVLFFLILAVSFLGSVPGYTEVATGPYHDGAERTNPAIRAKAKKAL
jgi:hypothetical protein